jgi:ELWxxDGT repeat protein
VNRPLRTLALAAAVSLSLVSTALPASAVVEIDYHSPTTVGDTTYFAGYAKGKGVELFSTDGTPEGTSLIKDIYPGSASSLLAYQGIGDGFSFTTVGEKAFFFAKDATGTQLWVTDGTAAGTIRLTKGKQQHDTQSLGGVGFNGYFYFASSSTGAGRELWKSDGTVAGTSLAKDFIPETYKGAAISSRPSGLRVVGDTLFALALRHDSHRVLYSSLDGATFAAVVDLGPVVNNGTGLLAGDTTVLDGELVFRNNNAIWSTDGATASILYPYISSPMSSELIAFDGSLFSQNYAAGAYQLHRLTDGIRTNLGVKDVVSITAFGGRLWYVTYDAKTSRARLWTMDSATATAVDLGDIGKWANQFRDFELTSFGGKVMFWSHLGLYETNGTPEGTHLAVDFGFGRSLRVEMAIAVNGDSLVLAGQDWDKRGSLWLSDGTEDGTLQVLGEGQLTAPTPTVSGVHAAGKKLTANVGKWKPSPTLAYQWKLDGSPIDGATGKYFTIPEGMTGVISFSVTGTLNSYQTVTKTSKPKLIALPFDLAPVPTISGTTSVGSYLAVDTGLWSPAATFSYQWYAGGKKITTKGTGSTLKVTSAIVGKPITVKVTGKATGYASTNRVSLPY